LKPKILFLIPDGVGIRNYMYSDLIKNIKKESQLVFWSTLPKEAFKDVFKIQDIVIDKLELEAENIWTRVYRESATFARLIFNSDKVNNSSILYNWNFNPKTFKLKILNKLAQHIGKWASKKYSRILYLEKKSSKNWEKNCIEKYKMELIKLNPKKIFITHQRVAGLMPICIAAKQLGVDIVSVIYSWDNIPKARLAVDANKYLVWSDYMKEEMKIFYPEINQENVIVTGTPQFEFYMQKERLVSKEEFSKKYNLDPTKKWICYSGDDVKTSPYDFNYLNDVAEAVSQIDDDNRPQIIFRRCPVDFSTRYDQVLDKYKEFIFSINPIWNYPNLNKNWGFSSPTIEDVNLQVNLAFHCDFVINLGSTMAFDFATFNKPCFYINYDSVIDSDWSVKTIYQFQHFKSMHDLDAVGWLNSKSELKEKIYAALENSSDIAKDKVAWMEKVIGKDYNKSSYLITKELLNS
jgi:hypothetical protein